MSAKTFSRDFALGRVKKLRRMKAPLTFSLPTSPPRNPTVLPMALRAASGAAGKHIRSRGAQRRADTVALQKQLRRCMEDF